MFSQPKIAAGGNQPGPGQALQHDASLHKSVRKVNPDSYFSRHARPAAQALQVSPATLSQTQLLDGSKGLVQLGLGMGG